MPPGSTTSSARAASVPPTTTCTVEAVARPWAYPSSDRQSWRSWFAGTHQERHGARARCPRRPPAGGASPGRSAHQPRRTSGIPTSPSARSTFFRASRCSSGLQFDALADRFRDSPFFLRSLYLGLSEVSITGRASMPRWRATRGVAFGSYPRFDAEADYRVKLTVGVPRSSRGREGASTDLRAACPTGSILRQDRARLAIQVPRPIFSSARRRKSRRRWRRSSALERRGG